MHNPAEHDLLQIIFRKIRPTSCIAFDLMHDLPEQVSKAGEGTRRAAGCGVQAFKRAYRENFSFFVFRGQHGMPRSGFAIGIFAFS